MSNSEEETDTGIADEQLPEDLQPGDDNPLAEGLEAGESAGDLLEEGKEAQTEGGVEGGADDDEQDDSGT